MANENIQMPAVQAGGASPGLATEQGGITTCGRTHKDALIRCAERKCYTGGGIRDSDADNIAVTTREVASVLGYSQEDTWYLSGYLKYVFLQLLGATMVDDKLRDEGVFVGELIAYAVQLTRQP